MTSSSPSKQRTFLPRDAQLIQQYAAMTSRNLGNSEKPLSPAQGGGDGSDLVSDTSPAVPISVVIKLLGFTFAMVVVPIGSYFFTLRYVFNGNSTWAGGFAALMANVVMIAYVVVAALEDQGENDKKKKSQ